MSSNRLPPPATKSSVKCAACLHLWQLGRRMHAQRLSAATAAAGRGGPQPSGLADSPVTNHITEPARLPQVRRVIEEMSRSGQSIDINLVVDRLARDA